MNGYKVQKYRVRLVKDGAARVRVPSESMGSATRAVDAFRVVLTGLPHEEVWIALLNGQNDIRGLVRVAQGGMLGAGVTVAEILRVVLVGGVRAFVMAHNHPSGDPTPSDADIEMTRKVIEGCQAVGLVCLDHLIVTDGGGWTSLRDRLDMGDGS